VRAKQRRMFDICKLASQDLKDIPEVLGTSVDGETLVVTMVQGSSGRKALEIVAKYKVVVRFEEAVLREDPSGDLSPRRERQPGNRRLQAQLSRSRT
jgi:hypothetical protein